MHWLNFCCGDIWVELNYIDKPNKNKLTQEDNKDTHKRTKHKLRHKVLKNISLRRVQRSIGWCVLSSKVKQKTFEMFWHLLKLTPDSPNLLQTHLPLLWVCWMPQNQSQQREHPFNPSSPAPSLNRGASCGYCNLVSVTLTDFFSFIVLWELQSSQEAIKSPAVWTLCLPSASCRASQGHCGHASHQCERRSYAVTEASAEISRCAGAK